MKKIVLLLICLLPMGRIISQDPSPEDILSRYLKAIGQDKFNSLETAKMTGNMTLTQQGLEMQVGVYQKKPDKIRQEMEVQGLKVLMVADGKKGWVVNPMMGASEPQDLDQASFEALMSQDRNDPTGSWSNPLMTWREDGTRIELSGKEEVNGSTAFNLKFTYADDETVNYIIDAKTYLLVKTKSSQNVQGQTFDTETRYSDYRDFDGIMLPGKIEMVVNGQVGQIFIMGGCEFNIPIEDSLFKKPVKD